METSLPSQRLRVLLWLAFATAVASLPAWTGSWIYDDWPMTNNPLMDDLGDVFASFVRNSADYQALDKGSVVLGTTYRPLSMFTLVATQAAVPLSPLAHHLVSLALHLSCIVLLWTVCARLANELTATLLATLFALHPAAIEAYGWINGRSDVLAGAGVLALVHGLVRPLDRKSLLWAALGSAVAVMSKEPAMIVAATVVLAFTLPSRGLPSASSLRQAAPLVAASAIAPAFMVGLRLCWPGLQSARFPTLTQDLASPALVSKLLGVSLTSLFVPTPRTMASLASELPRAFTLREGALLAALGLCLGACLLRGRLRSAVLLLGAVACVLPTVTLHHFFWNGLDRYLYMPTALACLAVASSDVPSLLQRWPNRVSYAVLAVIALGFGVSTFQTAGTYSNQEKHVQALIRAHPEDPSGYLMGAGFRFDTGDKEGAIALLDRAPRHDFPLAFGTPLASMERMVGRQRQELAVVDEIERRLDGEDHATYGVIAVRLHYAEVDRALTLAARLVQDPSYCRGIASQLRDPAHTRAWTGEQRASAQRFVAAHPCL